MKRYRVAIDLSVVKKTKTGTTVHVLNLVDAIRKLDPSDIDFVTFMGPQPLKFKNIFTKFLNAFLELYWLHIRLPYLAKKTEVDLIHFPANIISVWRPCKTVVTIHDTSFLRFPELCDRLWRIYIKLFARYAAHHADKILTVSEAAASDIARFYNIDVRKIVVTGNGFQEKKSEDGTLSPPLPEPYILYVGAIEPLKNLVRLIAAFAEALPHIPEGTKLVLVGPLGRDTRNVRQEIERGQLSGKVLLAGYVSRTVLEAYYANARLFVLPSLNEGFGIPLLEAMSYGIPVIASNRSSIPEVVGNAAILFDPFNISDIAKAIVQGLTDENLRRQMIEYGYQQIKRFSWETVAQRTLQAYREVLKGG